jgi:ribosomal protein S18 acetylase RimI-like enzyme
LFLDAFYSYYIRYEPEHAWVAADSCQVVGFLTGCFDTRWQEKIAVQHIYPVVIKRAALWRYRLGRKGLRYGLRLALGFLRGEFPGADLDRFPAHLHINLEACWRGKGLGRRLLKAYFAQLQAQGVPGVHLHTTSLNSAACFLYERMGFQLHSERSTLLWRGLADGPVFNRCYVRTIP